jgi:Hypothetical protein (DUF2513)
MQRSMDLVRTILLKLETNPSGQPSQDLGIKGYRPEEIGYHSHIMAQEGLIEGMDVTGFESNGPEVVPTGLTWKGHEFLDLARDLERWNRAKTIIAKVGSAPISVWMKVLSDILWENVEAVAKPK